MTKYPGLSRAIGVLATSGIVATGMAALAAGPASAATLTCGMTITSSIKLHRNLNCRGYTNTTGGAITIGAAGVTVNLNGHTITGPGVSAGATGIFDNGYSGLTVTGGKLNGFYDAVDVYGAKGTPLTGVVIEHLTTSTGVPSYRTYSWGIYGAYLAGARIHNVTVNDAEYGIELDNSTGSVVSYNDLASPYYGLYDYSGVANTWSHNAVTDVLYEGFEAGDTVGTVVSHNSMNGTAGYGAVVYGSKGLSITRNNFGAMYDPIYLDTNTGAAVSYNKSAHSAWGVYSEDESGAIFSHNTFSNGSFGIETDYPMGVRLIRNVTNGNADTGVYIYTDFSLTGYSARLVHNTASRNRFGLYSQTGTSGAGNRAVRNTVLNCYNVACVRGALALRGHRAPRHVVPRAPQLPTPGIPAQR